MFWTRSGLPSLSISDWLASSPAPADEPAGGTEDARQAMLDALGEGIPRKAAALVLRIRSASDARSLWELRAELMTAISRQHGEAEGHRRLRAVTAAFAGLVPQARELTSARRAHAMPRRA